ncbi:MAG: peptidoglycan-binding protein [Nocardioides sp.]
MRNSARRLAVALATFTVLVAGGGTAYGVLGLADAGAEPRPTRSAAHEPARVAPEERLTVEPAAGPELAEREEAPAVTIDPVPEPEPVLEPGDTGRKVRELQARLAQLAWFAPMTTGDYDAATRTSVRGFQDKRGFEATGVVDPKTWKRLVAMSSAPTEAELFNKPGPTLIGPDSSGAQVRELEARLRQIAWFFGDVDGTFDDQTDEAVRGFQAKRGIPVTGAVDQRTLDLLEGMTSEPTADALHNRAPDPAEGSALDPRCTTGRALCIDKSTSSLRWVVDGTVLTSLDVRFGAEYTPTREGLFHVYWKDEDHVSNLYGSSMPFSMFFSRGQAVHYSSDFAARGYAGASHGCVNVRDYDALASLFDQVAVGDKVVVYWS